jgi:hypothetical protein
MSILRFLAALVCAATLAATPAIAQQPPAADAARLAAARELFKAMGSESQMKVAIETMTSGLANIVKQQRPGAGGVIDEVFTKLKDKFLARTAEVSDMVAPLWAEKFTADEMREIARFFQSPIGKKLVNVQPELMQRSMQMGMAWGQRIGQEVEAEARRELKMRGIDL